jgi:prepilin-type N-terminal cleavage/methylation domain-containing protein
MNAYTPTKLNERGFTLVELLVVIAIIGILAGIVVPNVPRYIMSAKYKEALTEINGIDTALVGILSDTGRGSFKEFLKPAGDNTTGTLQTFYLNTGVSAGGQNPQYSDRLESVVRNYQAISSFYNTLFYEMIRLGRDSSLVKEVIRPDIYQKLGTSYMNLNTDPWNSQYRFWMGPLNRGPMLLRSYRVSLDQNPEADEDAFVPYQWDQNNYLAKKQVVPGQPNYDNEIINGALGSFSGQFATPAGDIWGYGYPAPRVIPSSVYVWSIGPNLQNDAFLVQQFADGQDKVFFGGGDDPNNWDDEGGWDSAPK